MTGKGSGTGVGVWGTGGANGGVGVIGSATSGDALGVVGNGNGTGVGVFGQGGSSGGHGVQGQGGTNGHGVVGNGSGNGVGVVGSTTAAAGIGVMAQNAGGGNALSVFGKASFSRSGIVTVGAGHSSVTKTGVALTSTSLVLATLQQHATGVYVLAAVPNVSGSSFTVYLSKAMSASTKVAWFIVN